MNTPRRHLRRTLLTVESLDDRVVPSGFQAAFPTPVFNTFDFSLDNNNSSTIVNEQGPATPIWGTTFPMFNTLGLRMDDNNSSTIVNAQGPATPIWGTTF